MSSTWQAAKQLFVDALEQPTESQVSFVTQHATNPEQADHVLRLLEQHHCDEAFLESPVLVSPNELTDLDWIDGFTLEKVIGQGGMGVVYRAIQHQPRRSVAIKIMRHDFQNSSKAQKRFEKEIQLLAQLEHPGIAHVYQSGMNTNSQPWFAMELVTGGRLSDHLSAKKRSVNEKIEIIQQVVRAVAYAHQRGVIHRDLKPSNILIQKTSGPVEGSMVTTKIVDFGIAQFEQDDAHTRLTLTEDILGTLNYMSPERFSGKNDSSDPRIDIYSLGVIAFEILTGQLPHDRASESLADTFKNIESETPRRLQNADSSLPLDLDLIVGKAMAVEPKLRYSTAEELSLDLQRFCEGKPVIARPPSSWYRFSRYIKRHRVFVTAATITVLALTLGLIATWISASQARRSATAYQYEAEKANAINSFVTNDLLAQIFRLNSDESTSEAMKQKIDSIEAQVDEIYGDRPAIEAAVRNELGTIYYSYQAFDDAASQYSLARSKWESEFGISHPDTLKAISNHAQTLLAMGKDEAESLLRTAYELRAEHLGESDAATLASLNNYAEFLRIKKRLPEAEKLFVRGLTIQRNTLGEADKVTLTTAANLGSLYVSLNQLDDALKLHERSYQVAKQTYGPKHVITMQTGVRWVQTLDRAKQYQLAEQELSSLMQGYATDSIDGSESIIPSRLMARILRHQERYPEAKAILERVLKTAKELKDERNIKRIERDLRRIKEWQESNKS